jgi:predicted GNAT family acetyltransferase
VHYAGAVVRDNPEQNRFELDVEGELAFAVYKHANGVFTFVHTEVPAALQGRGFGSALAKGSLELVQARGEKIRVRCSFIAAYLRKLPEFQALLATAE